MGAQGKLVLPPIILSQHTSEDNEDNDDEDSHNGDSDQESRSSSVAMVVVAERGGNAVTATQSSVNEDYEHAIRLNTPLLFEREYNMDF